MRRLLAIWQRYSWRTPFVVMAIGYLRLGKIRGFLFQTWLKLITKGEKGRNIFYGRDIMISPGAQLVLGDNLYIGSRCVFEITVNPFGIVTIGENTWISHDCHICSNASVQIGANVLIGEFVSIRDTTHEYADISRPIKQQGDILGQIIIEDNVWIGRGALILGRPEGVVIGEGAVIGANSVVSKSVPPFAVVAGTPAKFIRSRE